MKKNKFGLIILLIGLFLILYPLLSDILFSFNHSTVISKYDDQILSTSKDELKKLKDESEKYNQELAYSENGLVKTPGEANEEISYMNLLNLGDIIGYVRIPKIDVDLPIYHGVTDKVLETGIGHMERTSLPTGKINSHCVLAGHSGLLRSRLFDDIDKLEIGDVFLITAFDETFAYEVDNTKVVLPEETQDIGIVEGKEYVTLVTCVPYGINSHRLLVRGVGIEENEIPENKLIVNKLAKENEEIKKEIEEKTNKNILIDFVEILEKIRVVLVIVILIAVILIKLCLDILKRKFKK